MNRLSRFHPLGLRRNLLLDCLGGHTPQAPGYMEPAEDEDIFAAFARHIEELARNDAFASDGMTALLLAAGRLLTGDVSAADLILDHLPSVETEMRFGQRYCPLMPFRTLSAALPLPADLKDVDRWVTGLAEQNELRAWLVGHREQLAWVEAEGVYVLTG